MEFHAVPPDNSIDLKPFIASILRDFAVMVISIAVFLWAISNPTNQAYFMLTQEQAEYVVRGGGWMLGCIVLAYISVSVVEALFITDSPVEWHQNK